MGDQLWTLPTPALPPILDSSMVAALLRCQPGTAEDAARDGTLPAIKYGVGWVFPTAALLQVVNEAAIKGMLERAERPAAGLVKVPGANVTELRKPPPLQ